VSENNEIKEPLNKNNKVPKLRFPEFDENWEENILSSYTSIISGGTPDTTNQKYWNGEINWFTPTEIGIEKYVSESQRKITSLGLSKSSAKLIKANSILLTSRATIGAISINKKDCATNQGFQSLIPNGINLNYLYYLISTRKFQNKLFIHSSKSTFLEISHKEISKLKINVPINKREQEKIGLFFDLIDNKIQIIKSKIDILKKYKKGTQKNIFDSSKTKEYLVLKNIVKFENKSKISANSSIENGNYILYKSGQKNGMSNDYSHEGIYIIANDGGMAQFKLTSGKFAYTDHCICFRCQNDEETIVLCNYLQSLEKKITYVGFTGTGLKNIDRQYLGMIRIPKVDNKKIAKSFILIDEAIRNYENILEKLTIIKKLLLKQMFI